MSLCEHAKFELELSGYFKEDSDYGGMIGDTVMDLIKLFASQGHSGYSAMITINIFNRLARFKTLKPIGITKDEWIKISDNQGGQWQNRRCSSCFSTDGGKTYYDIDKPERKWYQIWIKADKYGRIIKKVK